MAVRSAFDESTDSTSSRGLHWTATERERLLSDALIYFDSSSDSAFIATLTALSLSFEIRNAPKSFRRSR